MVLVGAETVRQRADPAQPRLPLRQPVTPGNPAGRVLGPQLTQVTEPDGTLTTTDYVTT